MRVWQGVTDEDLTESQASTATALLDLALEFASGQVTSMLYDHDDHFIGSITVAKIQTPDAPIWVAFLSGTAEEKIVIAQLVGDR